MTLSHPPDPLPATWARVIANSIATALRRRDKNGEPQMWDRYRETRALHPTGNPTGHAYRVPGSIPGPAPTLEIISETYMREGLIDPIPELDVPWMTWKLEQMKLAGALNAAGLMQHHNAVQEWLATRPAAGPPPLPFTIKTNRHGNTSIKLNAGTPEVVAATFEVAAHAAEVTIRTQQDVDDGIAKASAPAFENAEQTILAGLVAAGR